jgi:hypothetical protein
MSAIDDVRKLLQDLVTPDLKALEVRVSALEKKVDLRADQADQKIDLTRDLLLAEMKAMKASIEVNIAKLTHSLELDRRVTKIESERASDPRPQTVERIA